MLFFKHGFVALFVLFFYRVEITAFCKARFIEAKLSIFRRAERIKFWQGKFYLKGKGAYVVYVTQVLNEI